MSHKGPNVQKVVLKFVKSDFLQKLSLVHTDVASLFKQYTTILKKSRIS